MFEALPPPETDPILALMARFRADPRPDLVDLGPGVYRDETGATPVFRAIAAAERRMAETQTTKTYVGLAGDLEFCRLLGTETLGAGLQSRAAACQATGGSGALFVLARLLRAARPETVVHIPAPTWPNHPAVFRGVGLAVAEYPYADRAMRALDFDAMAARLEELGPGDVVLLHGCCHNPTGMDPTPAQWATLAEICARRGWLPLIDMAYAGFGEGWEADCAGMRGMMAAAPEALAAVSCSKNFGLYRDRAGAVFATVDDPARRAVVQATLEGINRNIHSMPPDHGGALVREVLSDPALRADWAAELEGMRLRIAGNRSALAEALAARPGGQDLSHVGDLRGMFSLLGLSAPQVDRLREDFGIYVVAGGRINVAGMNAAQADRVAEALLAVI